MVTFLGLRPATVASPECDRASAWSAISAKSITFNPAHILSRNLENMRKGVKSLLHGLTCCYRKRKQEITAIAIPPRQKRGEEYLLH